MGATPQGRLLIVDDEVELMHALCETLADQHYETVAANSPWKGSSCWWSKSSTCC